MVSSSISHPHRNSRAAEADGSYLQSNKTCLLVVLNPCLTAWHCPSRLIVSFFRGLLRSRGIATLMLGGLGGQNFKLTARQ